VCHETERQSDLILRACILLRLIRHTSMRPSVNSTWMRRRRVHVYHETECQSDFDRANPAPHMKTRTRTDSHVLIL
jgi:hypothetical protein